LATGLSKTKWNGNLGIVDHMPANGMSGVSLSYAGKQAEADILDASPAQIATCWNPASPATNPIVNRLYLGDNLPILALLKTDPTIQGRVRLVYIDPPFSTKGVFQSRSQIDAYQDLLTGSQYIEFMRQRLIFLRELLAADGSIYVHLDENMVFYIKIIMDEVFGRQNFRNIITRKKCNPKNYTRRTYGNVSDYILFYTKTDDYVWNRPHVAWTSDSILKEYSYTEANTGRLYKKVPIHAPGTRNGETGKPWRGMSPPPGKHWQFPPTTLDEMDARGEIYWSPNGNPRRKVYLDGSQGIPVQDIWLECRDAHNQMIRVTGYPTEKNPELIKRIVAASSNEGDMVLDCFSGSGTTLSVASSLGRNWIGVDDSTEAIATTLRRFANGLNRMGDFVSSKEAAEEQSAFSLPGESAVTDFSINSVASRHDELNAIIAQWKKDIDRFDA